MAALPKIAIVYLSFHCEPYVDDVISSLKKISYPKELLELVVVDNPHPEYGSSMRYLEDVLLPHSAVDLPHVTLLPQQKNLGFSGGNNVGINWAAANGFEYIYLHNNDGFMASGCLEPLVNALSSDPSIGLAQSLVLLYPETNLVNTAGNALNFLFVGYCNNFRKPLAGLQLPSIIETGYASGAAVMLRTSLIREYGLWDEDFWMYHEDVEYTLRLKSVGYRPVVVRDSIFYHKYNFGRNKEKFYYIERNRLGTMLLYLRIPTLILFLPMALVFEIGLLIFAVRQGWFKNKLRAYGYWLSFRHWKLWLKKRHHIQLRRTVGDRKLLRGVVSEIHFEEKSINHWLLRYVGNPLLTVYWFVARLLIVW